MIGSGSGKQIERIVGIRFGRQYFAKASRGLFAEISKLQSEAHTSIGGHDSRTTGVCKNRDPAARRKRLTCKRGGVIEQLIDRVRAQHTKLLEDGIGCHILIRQRSRMRRCGPCSCKRAAGFDRKQRFFLCKTFGNLSEPSRIPKIFQIQEHHIGIRIVLPVFQQIIRGEIGFVSNACKHRKTDVSFAAQR